MFYAVDLINVWDISEEIKSETSKGWLNLFYDHAYLMLRKGILNEVGNISSFICITSVYVNVFAHVFFFAIFLVPLLDSEDEFRLISESLINGKWKECGFPIFWS